MMLEHFKRYNDVGINGYIMDWETSSMILLLIVTFHLRQVKNILYLSYTFLPNVQSVVYFISHNFICYVNGRRLTCWTIETFEINRKQMYNSINSLTRRPNWSCSCMHYFFKYILVVSNRKKYTFFSGKVWFRRNNGFIMLFAYSW
jgi:hypothetical protein